MTNVTIIGAGMMGTALTWPLRDNRHTVYLVGTPLDDVIITSIRSHGFHPRLERQVPDGVKPFRYTEIDDALEEVDVVICGVSSMGIPWFGEYAGPRLKEEVPILSVTKGLEDQENGDLITIPEAINNRLPSHLQGKMKINAIGGPCIAHELAARRQTRVVFCGHDDACLNHLQTLFVTPYYQIELSKDVTGVEVCAAFKNAYAFGIGIAIGMMEKEGVDGLAKMYNPQAVLFARSCVEMGGWLRILGGDAQAVIGLPGTGDLFVTVFGGRTVRLGSLIGSGLVYEQAIEQMADETLECVEIIQRVGRAMPKLESRGILSTDDFPLMTYLHQVISADRYVEIPWEALG